MHDPPRSFMNREENAYPVAGAVVVIQAGIPERSAGKTVEFGPDCAFGKLGRGQCDMPF